MVVCRNNLFYHAQSDAPDSDMLAYLVHVAYTPVPFAGIIEDK